MRSPRVALYAGHQVARRRIESALDESGIEVTVAARSLDELLDASDAAAPDVIVMSYEVGVMDRASALRLVRARYGETPLVIVSSGDSRPRARSVLRMGIDALVLESELETALSTAVVAVLSGQMCLPAALREPLTRPVFSHREKQVLELLNEGLTNGQIAAELYLSESTVKSHISSSFRKLGVSSRAAARERLGDSGLGLAPDVTPDL